MVLLRILLLVRLWSWATTWRALNPPLAVRGISWLLLASLCEVPLGVLVIHDKIGELVLTYEVVDDRLRSLLLLLLLILVILLCRREATRSTFNLLISLLDHLIYELLTLCLILTIATLTTWYAHWWDVLPLTWCWGVLRHVMMLLHHLLLLLLLHLLLLCLVHHVSNNLFNSTLSLFN